MPANLRSLRLTETYRRRLFALREQVQGAAPGIWDQADRLAAVVEQAQKASLRLTSAYLAAFLASETGKPVRDITIDTRAYSGSTADGKPLAEGMRSPLIGYLTALKQGSPVEEARAIGIDRAKRQVGMNYDAGHRTALMETIAASDYFDGWTRAVRGTCGACAARAGGHSTGLLFPAHPSCACVAEPSVAGVSNRYPRPTGTEIFNAKSREEQDAMVGPEAAEQLRTGQIVLADLAGESQLDSEADDFITQKPL